MTDSARGHPWGFLLQGAPVFYDNWVARDINGTALENAPFEQIFHHTESEKRFMHHLPVQGEIHVDLRAGSPLSRTL